MNQQSNLHWEIAVTLKAALHNDYAEGTNALDTMRRLHLNPEVPAYHCQDKIDIQVPESVARRWIHPDRREHYATVYLVDLEPGDAGIDAELVNIPGKPAAHEVRFADNLTISAVEAILYRKTNREEAEQAAREKAEQQADEEREFAH